jgi:hypothetical protein
MEWGLLHEDLIEVIVREALRQHQPQTRPPLLLLRAVNRHLHALVQGATYFGKRRDEPSTVRLAQVLTDDHAHSRSSKRVRNAALPPGCAWAVKGRWVLSAWTRWDHYPGYPQPPPPRRLLPRVGPEAHALTLRLRPSLHASGLSPGEYYMIFEKWAPIQQWRMALETPVEQQPGCGWTMPPDRSRLQRLETLTLRVSPDFDYDLLTTALQAPRAITMASSGSGLGATRAPLTLAEALPALRNLGLVDAPTAIPAGLGGVRGLQSLTALTRLQLYHCAAESLQGLHHLSALTQLDVVGCGYIDNADGTERCPALRSLRFEDCESLEWLWHDLPGSGSGKTTESGASPSSPSRGPPTPSSPSRGPPTPSSPSRGPPTPSSPSRGSPTPSSPSRGPPAPLSCLQRLRLENVPLLPEAALRQAEIYRPDLVIFMRGRSVGVQYKNGGL